jgi:type I restriction enzyme M protein
MRSSRDAESNSNGDNRIGELSITQRYQPRQASLDIFWLRDESLEESDNPPDADVLAQEIVEDLEAALEQFREIALDLAADEPTEKNQ